MAKSVKCGPTTCLFNYVCPNHEAEKIRLREKDESEVRTCIAHTSADIQYRNRTWCGKSSSGVWCFKSIDHATYNNILNGRLLPCVACVKEITANLYD